jgi:CubicO group peptidase (beta-lactamase class C family)
MERGLLSIDTPVSDLFPEFKSCVIVEDSDITGEPSTLYRPAKQTMTVEHLMHHTSGLFYSSASAQDWDSDLSNPYSYPQSAEDPVGEFLRWIKVSSPSVGSEEHISPVMGAHRVIILGYRSSSSRV